MFKRNPAEKQLNINDPMLSYPQYIRDLLKSSWAQYFLYSIFAKIDELRFSCLFSDSYSRPNTPVNILVGLLILKELNRWTDEELIGALYFDYRVRYALGITEFEKERLCINTIGNFRKRLYEYAEEYGCDLLREEVDHLTKELIKIAGMDTTLARQDSFMISANCKQMGRLELIYTVNGNLVKMLRQAGVPVPESCKHYLEEKDKADQIYRLKKEEVPQRTERLLKESLALGKAVPLKLKQTQAYSNLTRLIGDQTTAATGELVVKKAEEIAAGSLQNPGEPEATYRRKGRTESVGYVLNVVEARDQAKDLSMIVHHERRPNIVSDAELGISALGKDLKGVKILASDGAFYSKDIVLSAEKEEIILSFSALNGRPSPENKISANRFTIDKETNQVTACPTGIKPLHAEYNCKQELYSAKFAKEDCAKCSLLGSCIVKEQKKAFALRITEKKLIADRYRSLIGTDWHRALADFRAGVEGVPSVLRRAYDIDGPPVRGLVRTTTWDHFKVMALNFRSFFRYCQRTEATTLSLSFIFHRFKRLFRFCRSRLCYGW